MGRLKRPVTDDFWLVQAAPKRLLPHHVPPSMRGRVQAEPERDTADSSGCAHRVVYESTAVCAIVSAVFGCSCPNAKIISFYFRFSCWFIVRVIDLKLRDTEDPTKNFHLVFKTICAGSVCVLLDVRLGCSRSNCIVSSETHVKCTI